MERADLVALDVPPAFGRHAGRQVVIEVPSGRRKSPTRSVQLRAFVWLPKSRRRIVVTIPGRN